MLHRKAEEHFILRLPEAQAKIVSEAIATESLEDRLKFRLEGTEEHGGVKVAVDGKLLRGKLVNLPTISETYKTREGDGKLFCKIADISQMVICTADTDGHTVEDEKIYIDDNAVDDVDVTNNDDIAKTTYPHGITPPLKNVRKKRFRKTAKRRIMEEDMEQPKNSSEGSVRRKVEQLLAADKKADWISFSIEYGGTNSKVENDVANMSDLDGFELSKEDIAKKMNEELNDAGLDGDDSDDDDAMDGDDSQSVLSTSTVMTTATATTAATARDFDSRSLVFDMTPAHSVVSASGSVKGVTSITGSSSQTSEPPASLVSTPLPSVPASTASTPLPTISGRSTKNAPLNQTQPQPQPPTSTQTPTPMQLPTVDMSALKKTNPEAAAKTPEGEKNTVATSTPLTQSGAQSETLPPPPAPTPTPTLSSTSAVALQSTLAPTPTSATAPTLSSLAVVLPSVPGVSTSTSIPTSTSTSIPTTTSTSTPAVASSVTSTLTTTTTTAIATSSLTAPTLTSTPSTQTLLPSMDGVVSVPTPADTVTPQKTTDVEVVADVAEAVPEDPKTKELAELDEKISKLRAKKEKTPNPALKKRFQAQIDPLLKRREQLL